MLRLNDYIYNFLSKASIQTLIANKFKESLCYIWFLMKGFEFKNLQMCNISMIERSERTLNAFHSVSFLCYIRSDDASLSSLFQHYIFSYYGYL